MSASCSRASVDTESTEDAPTTPSNKKHLIMVDLEGVKGKDSTKWSSRCGASVGTQSTEDVSPPSNKKHLIIVDLEGVKGKNATRWSSRCGFLIRRHIPIGYEEWRKIDECYKDNLWNALMKEFDTNLEPHIARWILEKKFSQYLRTVKSTLRTKHLKEDGHLVPKRVALHNRPEDINKIWWEKFVDIEYSEKKRKECKRNTENKTKHVIHHTLGRRSYVQLCDELETKNPEEKLTRAMVWKLAHKCKETGEVIPCAAEKYASIEAAETSGVAGEKRKKPEAGKSIETLIKCLEKRKGYETGGDGRRKEKTSGQVVEERQNIETSSSGMNKGKPSDKASTEGREKRRKLDAGKRGMNNLETLLEAVAEACNENSQEFEREVVGPEQRKSHRLENNINKAKCTKASKAAAGSKEMEELRQWKMEIQDHVQTQIDDAIKLMSSKMLSMQHNMQQNILQFVNQHGGNRPRRTETASNIEGTSNSPIPGFGAQPSKRGRQYVMLLSRDLKDVAKGYVGTQKSCHRRKVVQNVEKAVWVEEVLDPEALIYDGPQNGKCKLSELGDGVGYVIWPVFRLRDL